MTPFSHLKGRKVLFLVGANASGKSDLGVQLALSLNGEVVSADSRQVYRGLDIGSGKIPLGNRGGIPHHLLDIVDPGEDFSLYEYQLRAFEALHSITSRGALPIVVGGTGLYVDAVAEGYSLANVPANKILRDELSAYDREDLLKIIRELEPESATLLEGYDKRRIIRAIEIIKSGISYRDTRARRPLISPTFVGVRWERSVHKTLIRRRLEKRVDGMIEEVRSHLENGIPREFFWNLGLEYRYSLQLLEGQFSRGQFFEGLYIAIGQFAKRQMTWFKRNTKIKWIDAGEGCLLRDSLRHAEGIVADAPTTAAN